MVHKSVVFVAFQERENLGIGYMHAVLSRAGYDVHVIDIRKERTEVLKELKELDPLLVGFSVIFENYIYDFQELIGYLRTEGITCHFTAGGHFASLRPAELLEIAPELDSMVRFEGEHTILDLVNHLHRGRDWHRVTGIAYRHNGSMVNNPLRALEPDLDLFPYPLRPELKTYALGKKFTTLLAGRGCIYHCAFCDIREFYGQPPGTVKRIRNPERVVEEMAYLYENHECRVFLFQDDDFPLRVNRTARWVDDFCRSIEDRKLKGEILWKINCRPDEVDRALFELMKDHGLFKVYLGIEDGTDSGLRKMNKQLKRSHHLEGVRILKDLGISIDYGFMLFQPSSTYRSINENLDFLEQICGDGYMPVFFLKMMPYLATRIEKDLREQGRLKGRPGFLDYDFLDPTLNDFYAFIGEHFHTWFHDPGGLNNYFKWVVTYIQVYDFFYGKAPWMLERFDQITQLTAEANRFIIQTMRDLSVLYSSGSNHKKDRQLMEEIKNSIEQKHKQALENASGILEKIEIYHVTKGLVG